jgi:hypothetical protein
MPLQGTDITVPAAVKWRGWVATGEEDQATDSSGTRFSNAAAKASTLIAPNQQQQPRKAAAFWVSSDGIGLSDGEGGATPLGGATVDADLDTDRVQWSVSSKASVAPMDTNQADRESRNLLLPATKMQKARQWAKARQREFNQQPAIIVGDMATAEAQIQRQDQVQGEALAQEVWAEAQARVDTEIAVTQEQAVEQEQAATQSHIDAEAVVAAEAARQVDLEWERMVQERNASAAAQSRDVYLGSEGGNGWQTNEQRDSEQLQGSRVVGSGVPFDVGGHAGSEVAGAYRAEHQSSQSQYPSQNSHPHQPSQQDGLHSSPVGLSGMIDTRSGVPAGLYSMVNDSVTGDMFGMADSTRPGVDEAATECRGTADNYIHGATETESPLFEGELSPKPLLASTAEESRSSDAGASFHTDVGPATGTVCDRHPEDVVHYDRNGASNSDDGDIDDGGDSDDSDDKSDGDENGSGASSLLMLQATAQALLSPPVAQPRSESSSGSDLESFEFLTGTQEPHRSPSLDSLLPSEVEGKVEQADSPVGAHSATGPCAQVPIRTGVEAMQFRGVPGLDFSSSPSASPSPTFSSTDSSGSGGGDGVRVAMIAAGVVGGHSPHSTDSAGSHDADSFLGRIAIDTGRNIGSWNNSSSDSGKDTDSEIFAELEVNMGLHPTASNAGLEELTALADGENTTFPSSAFGESLQPSGGVSLEQVAGNSFSRDSDALILIEDAMNQSFASDATDRATDEAAETMVAQQVENVVDVTTASLAEQDGAIEVALTVDMPVEIDKNLVADRVDALEANVSGLALAQHRVEGPMVAEAAKARTEVAVNSDPSHSEGGCDVEERAVSVQSRLDQIAVVREQSSVSAPAPAVTAAACPACRRSTTGMCWTHSNAAGAGAQQVVEEKQKAADDNSATGDSAPLLSLQELLLTCVRRHASSATETPVGLNALLLLLGGSGDPTQPSKQSALLTVGNRPVAELEPRHLKEELEKRGLSTNGKKAQLFNRLSTALQSEQHPSAAVVVVVGGGGGGGGGGGDEPRQLRARDALGFIATWELQQLRLVHSPPS